LTDRSEGKPICSDFLEETFLTQSALDSFQLLISAVTAAIGKQSLDDALENNLNEQFPADGSLVSQIKRACHQGIQEGWMCQYEAGGKALILYLLPDGKIEFTGN